MTEGSITKNILFFSIPLILGNLLQQLYSTVDSVIVGNFVGSNALAAIGSSSSLIFLLIGFSQGVSVGAGVIVSQYIGAQQKEKNTRCDPHGTGTCGDPRYDLNGWRHGVKYPAASLDEYARGSIRRICGIPARLFCRCPF